MASRNLSDWLEYYLKYTQNSEPPTQYHLWAGIAAMSSCLRRKCWSNWGMSGGDVYPNFYISLVGPPGGRKGTAMRFAKDFLYDLEIPMASDSLGSVQALYKELIDAKATYENEAGNLLDYISLSVWAEEFTVFISHQDSLFAKSITDLFDSPKRWCYRSLKRGIEPIFNCYLTIIGAITPSLLQESVTSTALGGGLFSRIIFVVGYGKIKKIPLGFLSKEEERLKEQLYKDLALINNLSGQFRLSNDFMDVYVPWYMSAEATNGVDAEKFIGYNDRRALHLKKLCMIFSASESNELIITSTHFKKALAVLQYTESEMAQAFYGLGKGTHASLMTELMRVLEHKKIMTWKEVLSRFQLDALPQELKLLLESLQSQGKITIEVSITNNTRYIWKDIQENKIDLAYLNSTVFSKLNKKVPN